MKTIIDELLLAHRSNKSTSLFPVAPVYLVHGEDLGNLYGTLQELKHALEEADVLFPETAALLSLRPEKNEEDPRGGIVFTDQTHCRPMPLTKWMQNLSYAGTCQSGILHLSLEDEWRNALIDQDAWMRLLGELRTFKHRFLLIISASEKHFEKVEKRFMPQFFCRSVLLEKPSLAAYVSYFQQGLKARQVIFFQADVEQATELMEQVPLHYRMLDNVMDEIAWRCLLECGDLPKEEISEWVLQVLDSGIFQKYANLCKHAEKIGF